MSKIIGLIFVIVLQRQVSSSTTAVICYHSDQYFCIAENAHCPGTLISGTGVVPSFSGLPQSTFQDCNSYLKASAASLCFNTTLGTISCTAQCSGIELVTFNLTSQISAMASCLSFVANNVTCQNADSSQIVGNLLTLPTPTTVSQDTRITVTVSNSFGYYPHLLSPPVPVAPVVTGQAVLTPFIDFWVPNGTYYAVLFIPTTVTQNCTVCTIVRQDGYFPLCTDNGGIHTFSYGGLVGHASCKRPVTGTNLALTYTTDPPGGDVQFAEDVLPLRLGQANTRLALTDEFTPLVNRTFSGYTPGQTLYFHMYNNVTGTIFNFTSIAMS